MEFCRSSNSVMSDSNSSVACFVFSSRYLPFSSRSIIFCSSLFLVPIIELKYNLRN